MRRARYISLAVYAGMLFASSLQAQWQVTGDAGVARLLQSDLPESDAQTFGLNAELLGDRWGVGSSILTARSATDQSTAQGDAAASLRSDPLARHAWALIVDASSFTTSHDEPTTSGEGMVQTMFGRNAAGASLGIGGGVYAHEGAASLAHLQADGWRNLNSDRFLGELSFIATQAATRNETINQFRPLSYADLSAGWSHERSAVTLGATAGLQAGIAGTSRLDEWASVRVALWFTPRTAIVASAGRTLEDVVRGVPRTRFVTLAIRVAARPHPAAVPAPAREPAGARITVVPMDGGRRRIEIRGVNATHVELMADFTDWNAVTLDRSGAAWVTERVVSPGPHRLTIRIDDGEWTAPVNLPHVTDDLGGIVGLITIP